MEFYQNEVKLNKRCKNLIKIKQKRLFVSKIKQNQAKSSKIKYNQLKWYIKIVYLSKLKRKLQFFSRKQLNRLATAVPNPVFSPRVSFYIYFNRKSQVSD